MVQSVSFCQNLKQLEETFSLMSNFCLISTLSPQVDTLTSLTLDSLICLKKKKKTSWGYTIKTALLVHEFNSSFLFLICKNKIMSVCSTAFH